MGSLFYHYGFQMDIQEFQLLVKGRCREEDSEIFSWPQATIKQQQQISWEAIATQYFYNME